MADEPRIYEMFWDCGYCGTTALLGKTNRYCPQCGAPQNPDRRYFPEPGREVAANSAYDGIDHTCSACQTPNGAKANNCRHCGGPLAGSEGVRRQADRVDGNPVSASGASSKTAPPAKPSRKGCLALSGVALALLVTTCLVSRLWSRPSTVVVRGHSWSRTIEVESFGPVRESAWCDALPAGAHEVSRHREQRGTQRIPDGQACKARDVDRGDGTFERRQECTTRYRDEPSYSDKCEFKVDRWKLTRMARAEGQALAPEPQWPTLQLARTGACLGCEREGARREEYLLKVEAKAGGFDTCSLGQAAWSRHALGEVYPVKVRVLGGGVDCDTLR
jgi:hypothetical protein